MPDTSEILRLRVLLCFLHEDETDCRKQDKESVLEQLKNPPKRTADYQQ